MAYEYIPEDYAEVRATWSLTGSTKRMSTAYGVYNSVAAGPADIADDEYSFLGTGVDKPWAIANYATMWTWDELIVTANIGGSIVQAVKTIGDAGTAAITPPSPNCTMLLQKKSLTVGRHSNGRMYLPPVDIDESFIDTIGVVDSGNLSVLAGRWQAWFEEHVLLLNQVVIFHPSAPMSTPTSVASVNLEAMIATQRRRMR